MNVGSFFAALVLGFVAGAIARALIPNDAFRHMHGWRSWLTSTGLGLLGALVGFWIFHGLFGIGDTDKFDWGGIVGAVIGAMIVVVVASFVVKRVARRNSMATPTPRLSAYVVSACKSSAGNGKSPGPGDQLFTRRR